MHDAQDQVKAFHSKMLMCDVMQEREVQKELWDRKKRIDKEINGQWEELEKQKMEEYDDKLRQKLLEEYDNKMVNQKVVNDQLQDYKMKYIKRIQDEMLEGELIKRQVQDELERERDREVQKRVKQSDQRENFK